MRKIIFCLVLFISTVSYSQKRPSQAAINDVVNRASIFFGIEQDERFRTVLNKYLTTYNRSGPSTVMANLRTDLKNRPDILNLINRASANRESLLRTLTAMNVNPKNVQEIADYLFPRPVASQGAVTEKPVVPDASVLEQPAAPELSVKEMSKPIEWIPPAKKFFDGVKTFCDSSGKWYYRVTIMKSNILLIKYPVTQNTNEDKGTPVQTTKAVINGENIVSPRNHPAGYKYENNVLFEKSDENEGWNKYVECTSK